MRRREKFVLAAVFLTLGLLGLQVIPFDYRYIGIAAFGLVTYIVSAWALSDDLQRFEWATIVPLPSLYALAISLFYFLLPENVVSRVMLLIFFGIGMYAIYLTANIYSVAKGRTIQLIHAAHAIGLLFTLLISLLFLNTIFSLRLPFYVNGGLVALSHFPLIFLSLWSVKLEQTIPKDVVQLSSLLTILLVELGLLFSFIPFSVWNRALFIMSGLYIGLGIVHSYLQGRLFSNIVREYSFVAIFIAVLFLILIPIK